MPKTNENTIGDSASVFRKSKQLIAIGKTKDALQILVTHTMHNNKKYYDSFLKISSTYHQHLESKRLNIISDQESSIQYSKINHNLLNLINRMENNEPLPLFSGSLSEKVFRLVLQVYGYLRITLIAFLLLISTIFFYFRRDVVKDVFYYGDLSLVYELFYPIFLLVIVLVIIFYKPKN